MNSLTLPKKLFLTSFRRWRWWLITVGLIIICWVAIDVTGKIAWNNYFTQWSAKGIEIRQQEEAESNSFWTSELIQKWETDPALLDILSGNYRSDGKLIVAQPDWSAAEYSVLDTDETKLEIAREEDIRFDATFEKFAMATSQKPKYPRRQLPGTMLNYDVPKFTTERVALHLKYQDSERACRDLIAIMQFADHSQGHGLLGHLVSLAYCQIIANVIWDAIDRKAFDSVQYERLEKALGEVRITRDFADITFKEMALNRDLMESPDLMSDLWSPSGSFFDHAIYLILRSPDLLSPRGRHMMTLLNSFSIWDSLNGGIGGTVPPELTIHQVDDFLKWQQSVLNQYALFGPPYIQFEKIGCQTIEVQQVFDFARIACALEKYYLVHHRCPDQNDFHSVAPVSKDRFTTHLPIRYQRQDGRYQLIASGSDRIDNGGDPEHDMVWRYTSEENLKE